jgi:hypothetical protein
VAHFHGDYRDNMVYCIIGRRAIDSAHD